MYIVYILSSERNPTKHYVGFTRKLKSKLEQHNHDSTGYARNYAPWNIKTYITFDTRRRAVSFEKYLKRGSSYAFLI